MFYAAAANALAYANHEAALLLLSTEHLPEREGTRDGIDPREQPRGSHGQLVGDDAADEDVEGVQRAKRGLDDGEQLVAVLDVEAPGLVAGVGQRRVWDRGVTRGA